MAANDSFAPLEVADEIESLKAKIAQLELREDELIKQKTENEEDFGQKRARFRELFLQKEAELKSDKDKRTDLEEQLAHTRSELDDIKMAVAVSEANKEEEISKIRQKSQQEIETMQALLREAAEEASSSTAAQYESERAKLQELNENYEEEIQSIRSKLSQERHIDKGKGFLSSVADIVSRGTASLNTSNAENENLEDSMRKAQQDAEILKSVVMPLEREIAGLKEKLKDETEKVRSLEKQKLQADGGEAGGVQKELPSPAKPTSLPSLNHITDPEEKIELLMKYLKTEKDARKDLEFFVSVMNTQKATSLEENDNIRSEMKEVCSILDEEKRAHNALKETWTMANDQFLESQRLMMMDMRRMEGVLTAEQQRMIAEQQQKDHEREAQEKKVKELEELRERQERQQQRDQDIQRSLGRIEGEGAEELRERQERQQQRDQDIQRSLEAVKKVEESTKKLKAKEARLHDHLMTDKSASNTSINSLNFDDSLSLESGIKKSLSNLEISAMGDQDILDGAAAETSSLTDVLDNRTLRISPEKVINLPSLTEAQVKALTDPTPENEARKSLLASAKSKVDSISLQGKRLVSDKEWALLQDELKGAREKLGRPCDMCNNYEAQLQGVQDELKAEEAKVRSLEREVKSDQQTLTSQTTYIQNLEENLKQAADDGNTEICSLVNKVQECEKYISELRQQYHTSVVELQGHLKQLSSSREEVQKELVRLQEENDDLQGKHSKHAEQLQNEDINLPNNLEEMQLLLLKYREEIIAAKVAQEHTEETLRSQNMFLKDQLKSEQQERTTMEEELNHEVNSLQEKLAIQDSLSSELERESSVRAESETKLREMEQALKQQNAQSKQLIGALRKQVGEQSTAMTRLEEDLHKQKCKVQSLQADLDNSVAVQQDFVKLSQSLQIQLEQLRQAETEVRWENEDDVEDCHHCRQAFSVTKRKHHCRHCGKIFCSDCITKIVNSGPKSRPSKVCDVCHTILVKDATPYYSTEPPKTPD